MRVYPHFLNRNLTSAFILVISSAKLIELMIQRPLTEGLLMQM